jgi:isopenicillin N synthase-like dioxygenase
MSLAHDTTAEETEFGRAARELPRRALPVLDIGPALAGDADAIEALAAEWRAVWEGVGFLCIVNHGVPQELIRRMTEEAKRFHDLPADVKNAIPVTRDQKGYIPARRGITTHSEFHASKKLDTVEVLVAATDYPADDPDVLAGKQFCGPMPWLPEETIPGFRSVTEEYMATITALGKKLLPVWARALELDAGFFDDKFERSYTYFRIAKYPPKPDLDEGEMGVNAHADTGFMTFLPPADEEGLQILDTDGTWFWPELPAGALIVNMGMFLGRWTNDRFRATPHRVVPPRVNDRYSLACFVNPDFAAVGECLPTCTGPGNPPKYPTQTYWEFFDWYMTNTFTHYGKVKAGTGNEATV